MSGGIELERGYGERRLERIGGKGTVYTKFSIVLFST
jgi:hypothetical protein